MVKVFTVISNCVINFAFSVHKFPFCIQVVLMQLEMEIFFFFLLDFFFARLNYYNLYRLEQIEFLLSIIDYACSTSSRT